MPGFVIGQEPSHVLIIMEAGLGFYGGHFCLWMLQRKIHAKFKENGGKIVFIMESTLLCELF